MKIGDSMSAGPVNMLKQASSADSGIQRQINEVQKKLKALDQNKEMSNEEKTEQRKELQEQLTELNKQLSLQKVEQAKEEQQKKAEKAAQEASAKAAEQKAKTEVGTMDLADMQNLISADSAMKQVENRNSVKTQLEGKAGVLKAEIKTDQDRGSSTGLKEEELAAVEEKVSSMNGANMSDIAEINKGLDQAVDKKEETKEAQKAEEEKKEKEAAEQAAVTGEVAEQAQTAPTTAQSAGTMETYVPIDIKL